MPLKLTTTLHQAGEPVEHVYFPGSGFCSVLTPMADGTMVEVATIGREGMVGMSAVVNGRARDLSTTMVQAEGNLCYRLSAEAFDAEMERRGEFRALLRRYAHALVGTRVV
jgi:CRP-like cAMP-binding protein